VIGLILSGSCSFETLLPCLMHYTRCWLGERLSFEPFRGVGLQVPCVFTTIGVCSSNSHSFCWNNSTGTVGLQFKHWPTMMWTLRWRPQDVIPIPPSSIPLTISELLRKL
jgi:hypothetical protein